VARFGFSGRPQQFVWRTSLTVLRAPEPWAERNSRPVSDLADTELMLDVLDAIARKLDGKPAAANTVARKRAVLHNVLEHAVGRCRNDGASGAQSGEAQRSLPLVHRLLAPDRGGKNCPFSHRSSASCFPAHVHFPCSDHAPALISVLILFAFLATMIHSHADRCITRIIMVSSVRRQHVR
jgi:hypothetical protein